MTPFDTLSWWDDQGPFKVLHRISPLRIQWILDSLYKGDSCKKNSSLSFNETAPLKDKKILDLGCGGGLLAEPLARLGADVTGIDASEQAIANARQHADMCRDIRGEQLSLQYHVSDIESWTQENHSVDILILMEVLEHVSNPFVLLAHCCSWIKPGGLLIGSTLNRTLRSYLLGIGMAEYILGWVPKGTHQWKDFLTPSEVERMVSALGFGDFLAQGFSWSLCQRQWHVSDSSNINYFFSAFKR